MRHRGPTALITAAVMTVLLVACGGTARPTDPDAGPLVMWTIEDKPDRIAAQQVMLDEYTAATGVETELVPIAEDQLTTALTSAAAARDLPDLVGALPLANVLSFAGDDILDTEAARSVVDELGAETFDQNSLELLQLDGAQLAVPSDAFPMLLYYRKDLFQEAGLAPPTDFESIRTAAETLDSGDVAGIVAATTASEQFTSQTIEHFALANGCDLVDDAGEVALGSPACVRTFDYFASLMRDTSVDGEQDTNTTRATYFSGRAGMVVWSSFLLDELGGLRSDALPTCDECADDPQWLAENTGVVAAIEGPDAQEPAGYGDVVSFTILRDSHSRTGDLVRFLMDDRYEGWIGLAPEGKVPTRLGTAQEPTRFQDAWREMDSGADTRMPLSDIYTPEVMDEVAGAPQRIVRWGVSEGQGRLEGAMTTQRVLPTIMSDAITSGTDGRDIADEAVNQAEQLQAGFGG